MEILFSILLLVAIYLLLRLLFEVILPFIGGLIAIPLGWILDNKWIIILIAVVVIFIWYFKHF